MYVHTICYSRVAKHVFIVSMCDFPLKAIEIRVYILDKALQVGWGMNINQSSATLLPCKTHFDWRFSSLEYERSTLCMWQRAMRGERRGSQWYVHTPYAHVL